MNPYRKCIAGSKPGLASFIMTIALYGSLAAVAGESQVTSSPEPVASPAAHMEKSVLLLFPYQMDLPSSVLALQGIQEELGAAADFQLEFYYEYLDLNRFPDPGLQKSLWDLLAAKYRSRRIDLVIVQNEMLLDLWLEHRLRIAPDAPVVFYDITTDRLPALKVPPDVVGVGGIVDYTPSVEWIMSALPSVDEIVLVHGVGQADEGYSLAMENLQRNLGGRIRFADLSYLPFAEIKDRLARLPLSSVVLYHLLFEDSTGVKYRPIDALRELAAVSSVPVLSGYDQFIGTGSLGGYMYSVHQQGRMAANIGLRILRGEAVASIPIQKEASNRFIFDDNLLRRFSLSSAKVPPDSVVRNRLAATIETHKQMIVPAIIIAVLLLAALAFLIAATLGLRKSRAALSLRNADLEARFLDRDAGIGKD